MNAQAKERAEMRQMDLERDERNREILNLRLQRIEKMQVEILDLLTTILKKNRKKSS